ncbi:MAG: 16S rRNA (guanine(527)-N(7))-methyltransferase RsmG [Boseongicola sp.]|nr:MAG: 16S rRNA (guanine(527)-N(7))-methyltransferase RsmG [Boseongicola sp.]
MKSALSHLDVSRETFERLDCYVSLLKKWTTKINLISSSSVENVWTRHIQDSAQLLELAPRQASRWCDLGSGGGLPGLVVAIISFEMRPETQFTLIESDKRKAAFLRAASREAGVPVEVITDRIEEVAPVSAQVVSARALAPLPLLLGYAHRHLVVGGAALLHKGEKSEAELSEARKLWSFSEHSYSSSTEPNASILKIGDLSAV